MVRGARPQIKLNKPIAVGFSILELSKEIMYSFFYDVVANYFSPTPIRCAVKSKLMICTDISDRSDHLDTSNFDSTLSTYSQTNKRILGKFKSETGSTPRSEFVGLRAKMYSLWGTSRFEDVL